jgi:acetolactate synthase-1/2/3 large subunit
VKVARGIVDGLVRQGVPHVFEMCGGMITHLLDALGERPEIGVVSLHHEQAAGFAAEAGARITGVPGVAMATSGPGATNLLTAIGSCYFDSVPSVFITGQVNRRELRGERSVRQVGFQETDIVAMARGVTKDARRLDDPNAVMGALHDAFATAMSDRPGPVLLDIPMDVQRAEAEEQSFAAYVPSRLEPNPDEVERVISELRVADRPLLLVGGGVRAALAAAHLREFVRTTGVPSVCSLLGVDALGCDDPLRVGLIGTYGNRWANLALGRSDLVVVIGSRLDVRQTGADVAGFAAGRRFVQIDIDPGELDGPVPTSLAIRADAGAFLRAANVAAGGSSIRVPPEWLDEIAGMKRAYPEEAERAVTQGIDPARFLRALSEASQSASAYTVDVGQNQMWSAQSLRVGDDQRFLTSGGMGAMGFALPAALGASLAVPGRPVICVMGDGGAQVNIQELESVHRLGLPVKVVVLNNRCLGMVRQFQDEYFESRHQSTVVGYGAPDFVAVAAAYGLSAWRIDSSDEIERGLAALMERPDEPGLLEVSLSRASLVRPKVAFGKTIFDMDPPLGASPDNG